MKINGKIEIVKNLYFMKMKVEDIAKVVGLEQDKVKEIINNIK